MKIRVFWLLLLCSLTVFSGRAQLSFSDSLRISLLTCTPGADVSSRFGHSGIRIEDLGNGTDLVFHYGVFSFNTPNFVYRFVKGETDYQLGAEYTSNFIARYAEDGNGIVQQTLRLTPDQRSDMVRRLMINYQPQNRVYRYSYLFDNCATRPYNLINAVTGDQIRYDSIWTPEVTLRHMLQEKTGVGNWLDFGISLVVAGRVDAMATYREQMFLPDYLSGAMAHATLYGRPVVSEEKQLLRQSSELRHAIADNTWLSPGLVFSLVMLMAIFLMAPQWRGCRWFEILSSLFDFLFLLATGLGGVIVWFLNFFSVHPAVDHNFNCLWLVPFNVLVAFLIWAKPLRRITTAYMGLISASAFVYAICVMCMGCQYLSPVFTMIIITLWLRFLARYKAL